MAKSVSDINRTYHQSKRNQVLDALGPVCVHCGFTDRRALQIDHINGDGAAHRAEVGFGAGYYLSMMKRLDTLQVLCANCNAIKQREAKEHRVAGKAPKPRCPSYDRHR